MDGTEPDAPKPASSFTIARNSAAVVDFVRVAIPMVLIVLGVLSILAGFSPKGQATARR